MKRFSAVLLTVLVILLLSSCESLGLGSGTFDFKNWKWNIVEKVDDKPTEIVEEKEPQKLVETINEKSNTTIDSQIVTPIKEEVKEVSSVIKEEVKEVSSNIKENAEDVISEVSNWFEVKEEKVKDTVSDVKKDVVDTYNTAVDTTKDVVEATSESLETAVSDVLSAMKDATSKVDTVIVVPSVKEDTTKKTETVVTETKPVETQTATQIAQESLPADTVSNTGSSAILIIILVAVGLIVLAIAYYCISIKRKSY